MRRLFILIVLSCAAASSLWAQTDSPQYKWAAEKREVKKDGITYRYTGIKAIPFGGVETEETKGFAESWARVCQDSILFTNGQIKNVVSSVYSNYLKALKQADSTGFYEYPIKDYKAFDITKVKYHESVRSFVFGCGAAGIIPLGELKSFVSPIAAAYIEMGPSWDKWSLTACLTAGVGSSAGGYVHVMGVDGSKLVRYYALSATGMFSVYNSGRMRYSISAGAGIGNTTVSYYSPEISLGTIRIGGPLISNGIVMDYKRRESINFEKHNHIRVSSFVRFRIYSDQFINLEDKILTPTINVSVAFLSNSKQLASAE